MGKVSSEHRNGEGTVRLADLLTGLALVCDLAVGDPPGQSLRSALVASEFARTLDLPDPAVSAVLYTAVLQHVGCTAQAHETAAMLHVDERRVHAAGHRTDLGDPLDFVVTFLPELTRGAPPLRRIQLISAALTRSSAVGRLHNANCEVGAMMADRLGLGPNVQQALRQVYEWWNGKGHYGHRGEEIALAVRVTQVASVGVLFHRLGGSDAAVRAVRRRAGRTLDPWLAAAFTHDGPTILDDAPEDTAEAFRQAEPEPVHRLSRNHLLATARAFGELVELKSPCLHGHSAIVTRLAVEAGSALSLSEARDDTLRIAALLHDVGRVGVPSTVWDKQGRLTVAEWEQARLHPYHTERILQRTPVLRPVAAIAGAHHERCDGSGYYRGATNAQLPMAARVLAAADAFANKIAARPYRRAMSPDEAAGLMIGHAKAGRLDPEAVEAVLDAAGQKRTVRAERPGGLTERQVDVLRLIAQGCSNREIARRLFVSPRTAEHHLQDIYTRIGVSSRAAAALFAMRHDLLG